jgi:uncharacterized protein (TIGR03086 family)
MNVKALFDYCLEQASAMVARVRKTDYGLATPDTNWDTQALVRHMLYELSWVPDIVAGKTVQEVGRKYDGDLIGSDLQMSWREAAERARQCVQEADLDGLVHLSYGDVPAVHYIREQAQDQLIHGWDLSRALGRHLRIDPDVAGELYAFNLPRKQELASSGLFADPVLVPDTADVQTKLLALLGRRA